MNNEYIIDPLRMNNEYIIDQFRKGRTIDGLADELYKKQKSAYRDNSDEKPTKKKARAVIEKVIYDYAMEDKA